MLRSTTWSIVTAHIDDNELYEDLLVNITKDVFSSTKTSVLASQRALRVNGPSQRPEWIPQLIAKRPGPVVSTKLIAY